MSRRFHQQVGFIIWIFQIEAYIFLLLLLRGRNIIKKRNSLLWLKSNSVGEVLDFSLVGEEIEEEDDYDDDYEEEEEG